MMKLYRETPCEHGNFAGWHLVTWGEWCSSVVREEVTINYDAAFRLAKGVLADQGESLTDEDRQNIRDLIDAALTVTEVSV